MFLSTKRIIATILIVAMTFTSGGFSTLAGSVDHLVTEKEGTSKDEKTSLSYKYYEEYKKESVTLLLNDGDDNVSDERLSNSEKEEAGDGAENTTTTNDDETIDDDSSTLIENNDEINPIDETYGPSKPEVDGKDYSLGTSSDADAEEETSATADDEEPEEDIEKEDIEKDDVEATASEVDFDVDVDEEEVATASDVVENADEAKEDVDVATTSEISDKVVASDSDLISTESELPELETIGTDSKINTGLYGWRGGNKGTYQEMVNNYNTTLRSLEWDWRGSQGEYPYYVSCAAERIDYHDPIEWKARLYHTQAFAFIFVEDQGNGNWKVIDKYYQELGGGYAEKVLSKLSSHKEFWSRTTGGESKSDGFPSTWETDNGVNTSKSNHMANADRLLATLPAGKFYERDGGLCFWPTANGVIDWKAGDILHTSNFNGEYNFGYKSGNSAGVSLVRTYDDNGETRKDKTRPFKSLFYSADHWRANISTPESNKYTWSYNKSNTYYPDIYAGGVVVKVKAKAQPSIDVKYVDENGNEIQTVSFYRNNYNGTLHFGTTYFGSDKKAKYDSKINIYNNYWINRGDLLTMKGTPWVYGVENVRKSGYIQWGGAGIDEWLKHNYDDWLFDSYQVNDGEWISDTSKEINVRNDLNIKIKIKHKNVNVKYNVNGGSWVSGYTPKTTREWRKMLAVSADAARALDSKFANLYELLPDSSKIWKKGYTLDYWEYNGKKVTALPACTDTVYELKAVWKRNKVTMHPGWYSSSYNKKNITEIKFVTGDVGTFDEEFYVRTGDNSVAARRGSVVTINADKTNNKVYSVSNLSSLFAGFENLRTIDFGGIFDTSNVTNMSKLFDGCKNLERISFGNINTSKVTNMSRMFASCSDITELDLSTIDFDKVTNITEMFAGDASLTKIVVANGQHEIKNAKTSRDTFKGCVSLVGNELYPYYDDMVDGIYARCGYGFIAPGYFTCDDLSYMDNAKFYFKKDWFHSNTKNKNEIVKIEISNDEITNVDDHFLMDADQGTWGYIVGDTYKTSFDARLTKLWTEGDIAGLFSDFESATEISGLSLIDTSEVTDMSRLFANDKSLVDVDVNSFDTSKVEDMSEMFANCESLTNITLSNMDTSKVRDMSRMFRGCKDITNITFGNIDTSKVENMSGMFDSCENLTDIPLGSIDTSKVSDMSYIFASCSSITDINLDDWDFTALTNAKSMFENCSGLTTITVNTNLRQFGNGAHAIYEEDGLFGAPPTGIDTADMFNNCTSLVGGSGFAYHSGMTDGEYARVDYGYIMPGYFTIDDYRKVPNIYLKNNFADNITKSNIRYIEIMRGDVGYYDTAIELYLDVDHNGYIIGYIDGEILKIAYGAADGSTIARLYTAVDFSGAFSGFEEVTGIDGLEFLDTSETTNMSSLFKDDKKLVEVNFTDLVLNNVEDTSSMFENCEALTTITYHAYDTTHMFREALKNTSSMFKNCSGYTGVLDLTTFRTSNVTDMSSMFEGMTNVTGFNFPAGFTAKVTDMRAMFKGDENVTSINLLTFNTTNVRHFDEMFEGMTSLTQLDLLSFSTVRAESMSHMFYNCQSLTRISSRDFDTRSLTDNGDDMFYNCLVLDSGAGTTYAVAGVTDVSYAIIDDNANGRPGYFEAPNLYILMPDWDSNATNLDRTTISKISILQGPTLEPTVYEEEFDIDDSFGLKGYKILNGSDVEVVIYAASESTTKRIYTSPEVDYIFGEETDDTKKFSNLREIENLDLLHTEFAVSMEGMFMNTALASIDVSNFDTANVSNMKNMFAGNKELTTIDLSSFDTSIVENMSHMFDGDEDLASITFGTNSFGRNATDMSYMFSGVSSMQQLDISTLDARMALDMSYMFYKMESLTTLTLPSANFGTLATNMSHMFERVRSLTNVATTRIITRNVTDMSYMFASMSEVQRLNFSTWETSNVVDMNHMMSGNTKMMVVTLPAESQLVNVTDISYMFEGAEALLSVTMPSFAAVNNMEGLFKGDRSLSNITLPDGFINNVTSLKSLFEDCTSLTTLDLNSWNTTSVTNMDRLFKGCQSLETVIVSNNFVTTQVAQYTDMFKDCFAIVGHEGTTYDASNVGISYAIIDNASMGHPGYFTGSSYTFGPGWNYDLGNKEDIESITFEKGKAPDGSASYPVAGGLRGVKTGNDLTFYITKQNIPVKLLEDSSRLFEGLDNVTTFTNLNYLDSSDVKNMSYMFEGLTKLSGSIDISLFNTDKVENMQAMFKGDKELENIILPANFGNAAHDMSYLFNDCVKLDLSTEISKVRTLNAHDTSYMFAGLESTTTLSLNNFDTASVSNMKAMFKGAKALTLIDVGSFDTSNVTDMSSMFEGVELLPDVAVSNFNTSKVVDMSYMFADAKNLTNLNLNGFDTSEVQNMKAMFKNAERITGLDLRQFDTGNVVDMSYMFSNCYSLTSITVDNTVGLNTSNVTNMSHMFDGAMRINNYSSVVGKFDTSNVTDMSYMFASNSNVTELDLNSFNTQNVVSMSYMFANSKRLTRVLFPSNFANNVQDMSGVFYNCEGLVTLDLQSFETANVVNMSKMFKGARNLRTVYATTLFNTDAVVDSSEMFEGCVNILGFAGTRYDVNHIDKEYAFIDGTNGQKGYFSLGRYTLYPSFEYPEAKSDITKITISRYPEATPTDVDDEWPMNGGLRGYRVGTELTMYAVNDADIYLAENAEGLFRDMPKLEEVVGLEIVNTQLTKNMSYMFAGDEKLKSVDLTGFNTSRVTNMVAMFKEMKSVEGLDVSSFDTSNVTDMSYMFEDVATLSSIDVHNFVTASVSNMQFMFSGMKNVTTLDLSNFDTSKVTNMAYMFSGMSKVASISITSFDTKEVTNMAGMFKDDELLTLVNTYRFNTSKVDNMTSMFENVRSMTDLNVLNFNVSNVRSFANMFRGMSSIEELDISSFIPTSATNVSKMFSDMTELTTIYASAKFELSDGITDTDMFADSTKINGGAGTVWSRSHIDSLYARIDKGLLRPGYFTGQAYAAHLIANGGTFADGSTEKLVVIYAGEYTNKLELPMRKGWKFDVWTVEYEPIDETWTYVSDRVTDVYATWVPNKYNLVYDANGGEGEMPATEIEVNEDFSAVDNRFTRRGYDFTEWSFEGKTLNEWKVEAEALGQTLNNYTWQYIVDTAVDYLEEIPAIKLVANWKEKKYAITYHGNGGALANGAVVSTDSDVVYGVEHKLSRNQFVKEGYTFNGWSYSADGARIFADMASMSVTNYRANVDLYAKWISNEDIYGVLTLKGNSGTVNGKTEDIIYLTRYNPVPVANAYKEGYNFTYWASGSEVVGYPTDCDFEEMTLTANWSPIDYTVRYHSNDGTLDYVDKQARYDEEHTVASYSGADRFGYEVTGWTDDPYSRVVKYALGAKVKNLVSENNKIKDLYAIWTNKTYSITMHDFGTEGDRVETYTYGRGQRLVARSSASMVDASGVNMLFSGWATMSSAQRVAYFDNHKADTIYIDFNGRDNIDLYPAWIEANFAETLTFDANGGFIDGQKRRTIQVMRNQIMPYPNTNTIERNGYIFEGWYGEKECINPYNSAVVDFDNEKTIYAKWGLGSYTVEYVGVNHTSGNMTSETVSYTATLSIADNRYVRTGYTFVGWDVEPSAKIAVYREGDEVSKLGDNNKVVKLYTVWKENVYAITHKDSNGNVIGTVDLRYEGRAQLLSNTNLSSGMVDGGFRYVNGGTGKTFKSGVYVTKDDFIIDDRTSVENGIVLDGKEQKERYVVKFYTGTTAHYLDGSQIRVASISYGDIINWPTDMIENENRALDAWGVRRQGDGRFDKQENATYDKTKSVTFEAIWITDGYLARLNAGEGVFDDGTVYKEVNVKYGETTLKLPVPSRKGYIFDEYSVEGVPMRATWSYTEADDSVFDANWKPINYYVLYSPGTNGEGAMGIDIATYGEPYKVKDNEFTREGFDFSSWLHFNDGNNTMTNVEFIEEGTMVLNKSSKQGDIVELTASWVPKEYVISYDGNGATRVTNSYHHDPHINDGYVQDEPTSSGLYGAGLVSKMRDSRFNYGFVGNLQTNAYVREGYNFVGWALSTNSTVMYEDGAALNLKDMYSKDIKLYAIWQKEEEYYGNLILEGNGGLINGVPSFQTYLSVEEPILTPSVEKTGYRFTNWTDDDGNVVTYPEKCVFRELRLHANWEPITYKVRYYDNFEGSTDYEEIIATYGETFTLPDYQGRHGIQNNFVGWALLKNATVRTYNSNTLSNLTTVQGKVMNLYAVWEGRTYIIVLHGLDVLNPTNTLKAYHYGEEEKIPGVVRTEATISDIGKAFAGWRATDSDLYDPIYFDGQVADTIYKNENKSIIDLYPVWRDKARGATIVLDGNEGLINNDKRRILKFAYGDKLVFPDRETITRKGYKFRAWVDSDGNAYDEDNTYINFVGDKIIKAAWDVASYRINYMVAGEGTVVKSGNTEPLYDNNMYFTRTYNGNVDTVIADNVAFERPGYEFIGWDIDESADTVVYKVGEAVPALAGDGEILKLYAVWQSRTYIINYYDGDGNLIGTNSILYGKNVRVLPNDNIGISDKDAGYSYQVDGVTYHFSSGQSVSGTDLVLDKAQSTNALTPVSESPANIFGDGILGKIFNKLFGNLFGDPVGVTPSNPAAGTISLYGDKVPAVYVVTFNANGGTYADGTTVKEATASNGDRMSAKYPNPLPRNGKKEMLGWKVNNVLVKSETYDWNESVTFEAIWEKDYNARLNANGGVFADGMDRQLVPMRYREGTDKLEVPTRVGYAFDKYYVDGEELRATWSYIAIDTTNVDATWIPNKYKVVYTSGGGEGYMAAEIATYDSAYKVAANTFAKAGYEFAGWRCGNQLYNVDAEVYNLTAEKNGIVKLVATWTPKMYNITYHGQGGVVGGATTYTETNITYGTSHRLTANRFTRAGYTFRGWAYAADGGVIYFNNATLSKDITYSENIDLYAVWLLDSEKYGQLILHGGGGLINGVADITIDYRLEEAISEPMLEYEGHTFVNWVDNNGNLATFPERCLTGWTTMELTATWDANKYTVRYYESENSSTYIEDVDIEYGQPYTIQSKSIFTKPNYTNSKWTTYVDGLEVEYVEGRDYTNLSEEDGAIINIYANFVGVNYNITLHNRNIEVPGEDLSKNYTYGSGENIESVVYHIATVSGTTYVFAGWTRTQNSNVVEYIDGMSADLIYELEGNTNIELWSVWLDKEDTVYMTFDGNGGLVNGRTRWSIPVASGSNIIYPRNNQVVRRGWEFVDWKDKKTGGVTFTETSITEDTTVYADWSNGGFYTITYNADSPDVFYNGSPVSQTNRMGNVRQRAFRDANIAINTYTKVGYTFIGWDTKPDAKDVVYRENEVVSQLGEVGETINLWTVWKAKEYTINYYDVQGANIGSNVLTYGKKVNLLSNTNIPIGSIDKGWTLTAGSNVTDYISGQLVSGRELHITESTDINTGINLYGLSDKITYVVKFNANGGMYYEGTAAAVDIIETTAHYGDLMNVILSASPSNGTNTFNGYTVNGAYYWSQTYDFTVGVEFKALWDQVPFTIIFNENAPMSPSPIYTNAVTGTMERQPAFSNIPFKIKHNAFSVVGYEFIGWATQSYTQYEAEAMREAGSDLILPDGPADPADPTARSYTWMRTLNQDVNLYALWGRTKTRVRLIQNEDAAKCTIPDPYVASGEIYYDSLFSDYSMFDDKSNQRDPYIWTGIFTTMRLPNPVDKERYINSGSATGNRYYNTSINRVVGQLDLYPLWRNETKTITMQFDPDEGELPELTNGYPNSEFVGFVDAPYYTPGYDDEPKYSDGKIVDLIATPYELRIFEGWSENADGSNVITSNTIYNGAVTTIYGNIRFRDNYTVHYDGNGATGGTMNDSLLVEGIAGKLSNNEYVKDGYSFNKWKVQATGVEYGNGATILNPNASLTLLAQWKEEYIGSGKSPSGGGGGGGGGGGATGGTMSSKSIDVVVLNPMFEGITYQWILDKDNNKSGIKVLKNSEFARALLATASSAIFAERYSNLDDNYIQLKNIIVNVNYQNENRYYGFDLFGYMLKGFVNMTNTIKLYAINPLTGLFTSDLTNPNGLYYFNDIDPKYYGALWNQPVVVKNYAYTFDTMGRVLTKDAVPVWTYEAETDRWKCYVVDSTGIPRYYKDGVYKINTFGVDKFYLFDSNGYMRTGLVNYDGATYYLQETGNERGALWTGPIILNGVAYQFGINGKMEYKVSLNEL